MGRKPTDYDGFESIAMHGPNLILIQIVKKKIHEIIGN